MNRLSGSSVEVEKNQRLNNVSNDMNQNVVECNQAENENTLNVTESEADKDKNRCKSLNTYLKSLFSFKTVQDLIPITKWLPRYNLHQLRCDVIAGLTVALTVIPQGLAYAAVAGLELQYGLYSAFMGCFIYCIFGTSKDITLGPTAIMSILVAEYARDPWSDSIDGDETSNVTLAILLSFTCGIIQIAMSIFRLGFLVSYISHPVITGFTSAAAIVIAASQIKKILGITASREFFHMVPDIFHNIGETNGWDVLMGISCIIVLFAMKQAKKRWGNLETDDRKRSRVQQVLSNFLWFMGTARNAVVVIISGTIAYAVTDMSLPSDERPITLTPNISGGLPPFKAPSFTEPIPGTNETASFGNLLSHISSGLAVIPLMGFLESIAISQAFARKNNYRIRPTQELFAIGMSNLMGSFVGSYPITGSFSRTAVNSQSHVTTPLGGIVTGTVVLLSLRFVTDAFQYIPSAGLAAVIIMAVMNMFDLKTMKLVWTVNKIDAIPLAATFLLCFWDLAYGILSGVGLSLVILLASHARPKISGEKHLDNVVIVRAEDGLVFPAADYFENFIENQATENTRVLVLECSGVRKLDFSATHAFYHCAGKLHKSGIEFVVAGLKVDLQEKLRLVGLSRTIVKFFDSVADALQYSNGAECLEDLTEIEKKETTQLNSCVEIEIDEDAV